MSYIIPCTPGCYFLPSSSLGLVLVDASIVSLFVVRFGFRCVMTFDFVFFFTLLFSSLPPSLSHPMVTYVTFYTRLQFSYFFAFLYIYHLVYDFSGGGFVRKRTRTPLLCLSFSYLVKIFFSFLLISIPPV